MILSGDGVLEETVCGLRGGQTCEEHTVASRHGSPSAVQAVCGCQMAAATGCESLAWRTPLSVTVCTRSIYDAIGTILAQWDVEQVFSAWRRELRRVDSSWWAELEKPFERPTLLQLGNRAMSDKGYSVECDTAIV